MNRIWKMITGILVLFIFIPLAYLLYDRSLIPPLHQIPDNNKVPSLSWEEYARGYLANDTTPNAALHYVNAISSFSSYWKGNTVEELTEVESNGWHSHYPDLEKLIELNQYSLGEILKGAEMNQCTLPPPETGKGAHVPNYLKIQWLSKLMRAYGNKLESESKTEEALRHYLAIFQLGLDISHNSRYTFSQIMGIAIIQIGTHPTSKLMDKHILSETDYIKIIQVMNRTDIQQFSFHDFVENELNHFGSGWDKELNDSLKSAITLRELNQFWSMKGPFRNPNTGLRYDHYTGKYSFKNQLLASPLALYIFFNKGHIIRAQYDYLNKMMIESKTNSYTEFSKINWNKFKPDDIYSRYIQFNSIQLIFTRQMVEKSRLRITEIQAAIHLYHLQNKKYPEKLEDLKIYFTEIPKDPFTDKDFLWANVSPVPFAYSIGPDFMDNQNSISYDPTNGTISNGDIKL